MGIWTWAWAAGWEGDGASGGRGCVIRLFLSKPCPCHEHFLPIYVLVNHEACVVSKQGHHRSPRGHGQLAAYFTNLRPLHSAGKWCRTYIPVDASFTGDLLESFCYSLLQLVALMRPSS